MLQWTVGQRMTDSFGDDARNCEVANSDDGASTWGAPWKRRIDAQTTRRGRVLVLVIAGLLQVEK